MWSTLVMMAVYEDDWGIRHEYYELIDAGS